MNDKPCTAFLDAEILEIWLKLNLHRWNSACTHTRQNVRVESAGSCNGRRDKAVLANLETLVSINVGPKYSLDIVSDAEVI